MVYTLKDYQYGDETVVPHSFTIHGDRLLSYLPQPLAQKRVLDLGCGRGFWSDRFAKSGAIVTGVDASNEGIERARASYPNIDFRQIEINEDLLQVLGQDPFDAVVSIEVVEHVYDPRGFARACYNALKPGGTLILTTPYHGYLKNLAIALIDGWDKHFTALWDGGHVKFWSRNTLTKLLSETGFTNIRFEFRGRFPGLWMGMVAIATKPVT